MEMAVGSCEFMADHAEKIYNNPKITTYPSAIF
jgi:hypothetical protein